MNQVNGTLKAVVYAMGAMLAASSFLSSHGAVSVTASRTYVVQETTLHASETSGQNVLIYTLGSQSNKFVVAKDGLDRATRLTPVTELGTTNVIGYYIGTNVNARVASSDWMSKVSGLNPVYGQGDYSSSVIGYTLGDYTGNVVASADWLSKVTEVKPIISSDDSPSRVVGYTIGTNAYVFASDKSVEVQQVKKVTGSTTNVVGYTIGGNTNNVFMSEDGVRQVIPNYPAVSNAVMRSAGSIFDGTNIVEASRNVYEVKHNSWIMYKYMNYEPKVPYELYYQGDVSYSNMTSKATGLIKDFYVSNRRIARSVTINGENVSGDIFIGVEGSTTNVVLTHERRSDGVYPIVWSYVSSVSNGVIYAFNGGGTQCDIRMSSDDAIETNFVGRIALKSDIPDYSDLTNMISSASEITDGFNMIKADGSVYELGEDYWVMTNIWGESNIFVKNGEYLWISIYPGSQTNEYTGEFSRKGYVEWDENAMSYIGQEGPGWYYQNEDSWGTPWGVYPGDSTLTEFSEPGWFYMRMKRPDKYVGKLALTNDFSTSNELLVATIESVSPKRDSDRITDGSNIIDAARYVWEIGYIYDDDWVADSSRVTNVSWMSAGHEDDPDLWAIYFTVDGSIRAQVYSSPPCLTQTNLTISASDWNTQYDGAFEFNIYRSQLNTTTNLVGRLALTNDLATIVPGNYETVSNRAMTASNYTDTAIGEFAATGTVSRAFGISDGTNIIDAAGNVYTTSYDWQFTGQRDDDEIWLSYEGNAWVMTVVSESLGTDSSSIVTNENVTKLVFDFQGGDRGYSITATRNKQVYLGKIALTNDLPDVSGYATQLQSTNAAVAVVDEKISTNNAAFVSAVLAVPLTGADAGDLAEIAEYGSYGTVGAAILALIAGLAALRRRVGTAETAIAQKASSDDLPYALVTPGEWEFSGLPEDDEFPWSVSSGPTFTDDGYGEVQWVLVISNGNDPDLTYRSSAGDASEDDLTVVLRCPGMDDITSTRASLPGHLLDRAVNAVPVTGATTLTLPDNIDGKSRDFYLKMTVTGSQSVSFSPSTGVTYTGLGNPAKTYSSGTYLLHFRETSASEFCVTDMFTDATLSNEGAAADAKAVGDALGGKRGLLDMNVYESAWRGGPEGGSTYFFSLKEEDLWATSDDPASAVKLIWWGVGTGWSLEIPSPAATAIDTESGADAPELRFTVGSVAWTMVRVAEPEAGDAIAKVSQIPAAQVNADWNAESGVAQILNKPTIPSAYTGNPAMDGTGSAGSSDSFARGDHVHPSDTSKASFADLPYRLVEPGKWEFSGDGYETGVDYEVYHSVGTWYLGVATGNPDNPYVELEQVAGDADDLSVDFVSLQITATRASLPGHLLDRAANAVPVAGETTLTLPEKIDGKSRDFYIRLTVSAAGDGSAVTFAATDSGGDAVTWDSMGDPAGTFAEGTYLYRITESDEGLMHAEDMMALEGVEDALEQINDGTATPSALDMKLAATSAAPAFDPALTYVVGEYVTYGGILYRCKIAVTVAGPWTGDSNWVDVDMTSPDATLDVRSDGRLAVVAADSEILWIQGYDMASASDVVLSCDRVNFYAFASGTTTQTFNMPSAPGGKVGDFVLDIDNSANASTAATATLNGFGTSFDVIVPKGQNLFTDILSFEGGEMCELYFTMTAFGTAAKPAWKVVKQVVEKQEAGS